MIPGIAILIALLAAGAAAADLKLEIEQLTFGPKHHFFGYIGHVQNIPWNAGERYIALLRTDFQDRPPDGDAAEIVLLDTRRGNAMTIIDRTLAWNFQQGTMMYWNPKAPETQLFFNDRDPETGKVFTVLYDVAQRKRIREFRYEDTPFGNSGVAQKGGYFLGINYGRMARLRPVTGYRGSYDWTVGVAAPENDGIFLVDTETGRKKLLVSFRRLADSLRERRPDVEGKELFINHTLWNRNDDRIYFYLRAEFDVADRRVDVPFTIRPDGTGLTPHELHIGGHPEWDAGGRLVGSLDGRQVLYDVDKKEVTGTIGSPEIFPRPGGDVAVSPDGLWIVNGYRIGDENFYAVLRRSDGSHARSRGFPHKGWTSGELRVDAAPCWNRTGDRILFPAIAEDGTRQSFLLTIR